MSMLLKMCPNCKGDLMDMVDQDNFSIYKCAQCSREFSKELFNKKGNPTAKPNKAATIEILLATSAIPLLFHTLFSFKYIPSIKQK